MTLTTGGVSVVLSPAVLALAGWLLLRRRDPITFVLLVPLVIVQIALWLSTGAHYAGDLAALTPSMATACALAWVAVAIDRARKHPRTTPTAVAAASGPVLLGHTAAGELVYGNQAAPSTSASR